MEINQINTLFKALGRFTPASFYTNRIPILSFPEELLEVVRTGELEYSKAKLLNRIKDETNRKDLLQEVLSNNMSREDLALAIQASTNQTPKVTKSHALLKTVKGKLTPKRFEALSTEKKKKVEKMLKELTQLLS